MKMHSVENSRKKTMALTMLEKMSDRADMSAWAPSLAAEFEREQ